MGADDAAADDGDLRKGPRRGRRPMKHAAPAVGLLQRPGTHLRREPTGDFPTSGARSGKAARAVGDGFVGDGGHAARKEIAGLARGRERGWR